MLHKVLALLLVFSLAFNIAFLGIWVHGKRMRARARRPDATQEQQQDGRRRREGSPWAQLGLSPEQERRVEESRRKLESKASALAQEAAQHRERLFQLLETDPPDQAAVLAEQEAIDRIQQQQRRSVIEQMLEMREILTPEQREAWLRMMRSYRERTHRRRGPAGPRPEGRAGRGPEAGPGPLPPDAPPSENRDERRPDAPVGKEEGQ